MKIKKYVAKSMPEAMAQIRKELGTDAVILNSKAITEGGFLGLFKKRKIEVIAALDEKPLPENEDRQYVDNVPQLRKTAELSEDKVLQEINQLKRLIEQQTLHSEHNFTAQYEMAYQLLLDQELDSKLAHSLISDVNDMHEREGIEATSASIKEALEALLNDRLNDVPFEGISYDKKIIQFVGPTGVGKTTTLAKVAAHCMLTDKKKVAFITADTYRIAAIDQLKTYARILDVPLKVAYSKKDFKEAIESFQTYDLILVDTAGRNYRDVTYINELKGIMNVNDNMETYLTLSLTAKPTDVTDIFEQFKSLSVDKVIFTKLDETSTYGSILNICLTNSVGLPYLTNGQDVPDDLIKPTPHYITNLVLSRFTNE